MDFTLYNDISFKPACKEAFKQIIREIRLEDRAELEVSHREASAALLSLFEQRGAVSGVLYCRGKAVGAAGVVPDTLLGRSGCVWLVTARGVEKFPLGFVKAARRVLGYFLKLYPLLYNGVDARYTRAVRFVRWLGGISCGRVKLGPRGEEFELFIFRRN